ncbi:MAG: glycosyltransferase family 9 protein [Parabacteroides sp.]
MANVLVIRLSAIGDVAMTIPVIYSVARACPQHTFTVLTQAFLIPLFMHRPSNVEVIGINTKGAEKYLSGLLRFCSALMKYPFDTVIDLHDVIRTKIIRTLFRLKGRRVFVIHKERQAAARLTRTHRKELKPLRPVIDRYADVFHEAGFAFDPTFTSLYETHPAPQELIESFTGAKQAKWVGIAPFAKHEGKIYPTDQMEQVVEALSKQTDLQVFLFGGKGYEEAILSEWEYRYPHVRNVVGQFTLDQELALISRLDLLLSMDSANMHFASLVGTRVLSIWGATHPFTGFYGYRQRPDDVIQLDLPCRPCSVFGQKPCQRGDRACLEGIAPTYIVERILTALSSPV